MYIKRDIEKAILGLKNSFQVITIYGQRQVGKTTTVFNIFKDFNYITLDDIENLELAKESPKRFFETYKWPLIIDEIQKAPNLLNEIKVIVDKQKLEWLNKNNKKRLMFVLTGSNQFELQKGISESLAGRTAIFDMSSMTQIEAIKQNGNRFTPYVESILKKEKLYKDKYVSSKIIFQRIYKGGMPEVVTGVVKRNAYFKSYINTYLEKDVRNLIGSTKLIQFKRFLEYLALRTSQQIVFDTASRELGIDTDTCKRWLSILVNTGIIILIYPYMANLSKRIIKSPKIYFMDTGLCSYLCRWQDAIMLENCAMSRQFFENFVISEIIKSFYNNNLDFQNYLYYYRDIDQKEIDLLYIENQNIYPIEIKKNISSRKPHKNFSVLKKYKMEIKPGLIITNTDKIREIDEGVYTYPISLLGY